uniref:receptor-interacting serine/threonine-protein kinase 3 n=1 Tax=Scatophagus argus TaxID=75038 RepID=UPI001ED8117F|nr:receptor-interacting serine/threonine-protein kinase 3 [Scatophagus argus]XP_046237442.1 receptor-interacting serine/threonine-protein kinase 3 [Scatophagus argus]
MASCQAPVLIEDSKLVDWKVIGSGGFGQIFKARHLDWCCDVAIKLLHYDNGSSASLLREVDMMRKGSSPFVIQVLGVFRGRSPTCGPSTQVGLVMEFMERGSLASLQVSLCETPPWPLVFRLAHQVALGINFLHNLSPAVLHLDLKPNNVLLDPHLNAKLTDFGLARVHHSVSRLSKKDGEEDGGAISYMPPEAFDLSYSPTRASDIYSYGILLWSVVTGKQPYANVMSSIVRFRIPRGDRPSLDEIRSLAVGRAGLTRLLKLMERCWREKPKERPSSHECTTETEELYKMHKHTINDAVYQVLQKLDENEEQIRKEDAQRLTQAAVTTRVKVNGGDVLTGGPPVQERAGGWTANQRDEGVPSLQSADVYNVVVDHSSTDCKAKVSSVHPIGPSSHLSSHRRSPQSTAAETTRQDFLQNQGHIRSGNGMHRLATGYRPVPLNGVKWCSPGFERQLSSPEPLPCYPPHAAHAIHIHLSQVTGLQHGDNNTMNIYGTDPIERRRHPTAPSSVNLPPPHAGRRRNKPGGVG